MLSRSEQRVYDAAVTGKSNKVIARDLGITEATVKVHLKTTFRKLGVTNRTELTALHYQNKLKEAVHLLRRVREACLYAEDDGGIGVTREPHIPEDLFSAINACVNEAGHGRMAERAVIEAAEVLAACPRPSLGDTRTYVAWNRLVSAVGVYNPRALDEINMNREEEARAAAFMAALDVEEDP